MMSDMSDQQQDRLPPRPWRVVRPVVGTYFVQGRTCATGRTSDVLGFAEIRAADGTVVMQDATEPTGTGLLEFIVGAVNSAEGERSPAPR